MLCGFRGLAAAFAHMDVHRQVVVAVEEESESIFDEYSRHVWELTPQEIFAQTKRTLS